MNIQAHMSGQQGNNMSQQNGNSQMQNLVNVSGSAGAAPPPTNTSAGLGPSRVDNDLSRLRQNMRIKM